MRIGARDFVWGSRTYIMGIINVTPDSFSGDGLYQPDEHEMVQAAVEQGRRMVEDGADILDVGGESTRPGASPVRADEELQRVLPVVSALSSMVDCPISIDTYKARVARAALQAGAHMVNDVWGLLRDEEMARVVAEYDVPVVIMHNQDGTFYRDVVGDILLSLGESISRARDAGINPDRIIVDPGIGFGKSADQSLALLRRLPFMKDLGFPVMLGTSRKSHIGKVLDLPPGERVEGAAATVALGIAAKVDIVRVHDVAAMTRVARMADAIVRVQ